MVTPQFYEGISEHKTIVVVTCGRPQTHKVCPYMVNVIVHEYNSAENFAVIRHISLNILKKHPDKMSLARKRRKCQYDADFMADVLLSAFR